MSATATATATGDDKRVNAEWSTLPKELWPLIAKHLNTTIDTLRFRSICSTWRSAAPLPPPSSQPLFPPQTLIPHGNFTLVQTTIYRLQPSTTSTPPDSSSSKGWIIMVGDSTPFPVRLLCPLTNSPLYLTHPAHTSPKPLNLIHFRFLQLIESFALKRDPRGEEERELGPLTPVPDVLKAVLFPDSKPGGARMVFALHRDGNLRASQIGDQNWTVLRNNDSGFDDVIVRTGQLYAVDKWGTISWIDGSSLKLVQFSPMLCGFGKKKHLVECGGSLYVVDTYIEGDHNHPMGMYWEVVDVKVYRLDEEWGMWRDVKNLGDSAFVLGKDSNFALSSTDYYGCQGNCVYLYSGGRACAFSLDNSELKFANLFWPCPSLFQSQTIV